MMLVMATTHSDDSCQLSRLCGLLYKLRNYTDTAMLKKVFYALEQPVYIMV